VSFTEFRQNLARHLDAVAESGQNLVVTRQGKASVVVMTLEEFEGWQETVHLLSSPANAVRLLRSVQDADEGKFVEGVTVEVEEEV
jgi:antitoxin YefM